MEEVVISGDISWGTFITGKIHKMGTISINIRIIHTSAFDCYFARSTLDTGLAMVLEIVILTSFNTFSCHLTTFSIKEMILLT
jgi:hypothetical protein